jgi:hypothetical protein
MVLANPTYIPVNAVNGVKYTDKYLYLIPDWYKCNCTPRHEDFMVGI